MATTIVGAWQTRLTQSVFPDIDASGAADTGEIEAQAAMDVLTTQGYFGHVPEESS